MRYLFLLAAIGLFGLVSCSGGYAVDFSAIDFPGTSKLDKDGIDSVLKAQHAGFIEEPDDSVKVGTDRKIYHFGEEVILSVTNNSSEIQYFYEANEDSKRYFDAFPDLSKSKKEEYEKKLISKDPGIMGVVYYQDPCLINLRIDGMNSVVGSKLGLEGFDKPLNPGESMTFNVKMPRRPGYYRFLITRHTAFGKSPLWEFGSKLYIISNSFEIVDK